MAPRRPAGPRRRLFLGLVVAATLAAGTHAQDANATAPAPAPAPPADNSTANASSPAPAPAPAPPPPPPPPRPSGPILFATPSPGCAGENVTVYNGMYANEGGGKQTLATLAWELAGRSCGGPASDAGRALLAANPQWRGNPNTLLAANEPVCVPAGLGGAVARVSPDPRAPRARPGDDGGVPGVRGPPPGCPRSDVRYADGGTTPAALVGEPPCGGAARVYGPGGGGGGGGGSGGGPGPAGHNGTLAALRALNAYAPGSPDVPLPDGAVVCVDLVAAQALLAAAQAAAAAPAPAANATGGNDTAAASPAPAPAAAPAAANESMASAPAAAPAPGPASSRR